MFRILSVPLSLKDRILAASPPIQCVDSSKYEIVFIFEYEEMPLVLNDVKNIRG